AFKVTLAQPGSDSKARTLISSTSLHVCFIPTVSRLPMSYYCLSWRQIHWKHSGFPIFPVNACHFRTQHMTAELMTDESTNRLKLNTVFRTHYAETLLENETACPKVSPLSLAGEHHGHLGLVHKGTAFLLTVVYFYF